MGKNRLLMKYDVTRCIKIITLFTPFAFGGCAPSQPPSDGTFATLNIEMANTLGDARINMGPLGPFSSTAGQTEILSNSPGSAAGVQSVQIPADQLDAFYYVEIFTKLPLKCTMQFSIRAVPGQAYSVIAGDTAPQPSGSNPASEFVHIMNAGDVPRCYVNRL